MTFEGAGGGGGGEYGCFCLGKKFFPAKPLAIELNFFFRDKQICQIFSTLSAMKDIFFSVRFFSSGISLKKSFPSNYSVLVFVFLFFSEITHTHPQKSNGRPLRTVMTNK